MSSDYSSMAFSWSKQSPLLVLSIVSVSGFGIAGTASRIALLNFTTSNNWFEAYPTCAVNVLGTFIVGLAVGLPQFVKETAPSVFLGLTVGFCGCFSTFSSWIADSVNNLENALVAFTTGIALPLVAFIIGRDLMQEVCRYCCSRKNLPNPILLSKITACNSILPILIFLSAVVTLSVLAGEETHSSISSGDVISCALSPIGALFRWTLAVQLNNRWGIDNFAVGIFAANIIAVIMNGALLKYSPNNDWAIYAETGICGTLSTVSGWIADTVKIYESNSKKWAYMYCLGTTAVAALLMIPFTT